MNKLKTQKRSYISANEAKGRNKIVSYTKMPKKFKLGGVQRTTI